MTKKIYKVVDSKGRVYLPREVRDAAGIEPGDIVNLEVLAGAVKARKVELIEVGDQSPETVEAYVRAAIKAMPDRQRLELIGELSGLMSQSRKS